MQPSLTSLNNEPDYLMLMMAARAGMISHEQVRAALGVDKDVILEEPTYEERRARLLDLCETEGTDMQLHNEIVIEALMYFSGDDPGFGNIVGEVYEIVERTGVPIHDALWEITGGNLLNIARKRTMKA
jgi:hypothetical protein